MVLTVTKMQPKTAAPKAASTSNSIAVDDSALPGVLTTSTTRITTVRGCATLTAVTVVIAGVPGTFAESANAAMLLVSVVVATTVFSNDTDEDASALATDTVKSIDVVKSGSLDVTSLALRWLIAEPAELTLATKISANATESLIASAKLVAAA